MTDNTTIESTSQAFLDIYDVTNDILIMKDGSSSLILAVDAVNFGLLAEEEQDAIMYSYAGLLSSINYPIQIVIRSQTKDVSSYLKVLQEKEANTFDEKKRKGISDYRQFVGELIKERNVLDKKFYVVIPASALELGLVSAQSVVPGIKPKQALGFEKSMILDKAITNLHPKRDHLIAQFARIGLFARQLTTQEIIQLFYISYNPEAAEGQTVADTKNYTSPLVEAGLQQGVNMMDISTPKPPPPVGGPSGSVPPKAGSTPLTPPTGGMPPATGPVPPKAGPITPPAGVPTPPPPPGGPIPPKAGPKPPLPGGPTPSSPMPPMPSSGGPTPPPATPETPKGDPQAVINSSVNELGGEKTPVSPTVGAPTPPVTGVKPPMSGGVKPAPGANMPPLPEI